MKTLLLIIFSMAVFAHANETDVTVKDTDATIGSVPKQMIQVLLANGYQFKKVGAVRKLVAQGIDCISTANIDTDPEDPQFMLETTVCRKNAPGEQAFNGQPKGVQLKESQTIEQLFEQLGLSEPIHHGVSEGFVQSLTCQVDTKKSEGEGRFSCIIKL